MLHRRSTPDALFERKDKAQRLSHGVSTYGSTDSTALSDIYYFIIIRYPSPRGRHINRKFPSLRQFLTPYTSLYIEASDRSDDLFFFARIFLLDGFMQNTHHATKPSTHKINRTGSDGSEDFGSYV